MASPSIHDPEQRKTGRHQQKRGPCRRLHPVGRCQPLDHQRQRGLLLSGKQLCIWYDGSNSVYRADLSVAAGRQELDEFSRLLTYEGILDVPAGNILDAAYLDHDGQNCIYAKYKSADGNYVNQIYVSISSGLLISAEIDQNETPVYEMESVSTDLSVPSDSSFAVPG